MVDTLTTVGGWGAVVMIGVGTYWYYTQKGRTKIIRKGTREDQPSSHRGVFKEHRRKDKGSASEQGGSDAPDLTVNSLTGSGKDELKQRKKDKKKKKTNVVQSGGSAVDTTPIASRALPIVEVNGRADDADDTDKAFALQLQNARQGTSLKSTEKSTTQTRTLKQGKANRSAQDLNSADITESSTPPSTTGGDADDDLSPGVSPSLNASPSKADTHGISDMLEAPNTGPTTLRLVPSAEPQRVPKPKKMKPVEEAETKKQRQRKAKNEARKAENAEIEKQRRALMEKQMKTARTAEGTAKSGKYRTYSNTPATNAWGGQDEEQKKESVSVDDSFLDTFDSTSRAAESNPGGSNGIHGTNGTNGTYAISEVNAADLSSSGHSDEWENLQMRNIAQQEQHDGGWQEVPAKKTKQAKRNGVPA